MDIKTDKILYIENEEYSRTLLFPGSLLKPFAILSTDINHKELKCDGWDNIKYRCWTKEGHGTIQLEEAIAFSCNSYFLKYFDDNLNISSFHKTLTNYVEIEGNILVNNYLEQAIGLGSHIMVTPINILKGYNKLFKSNLPGLEVIRQGMKESTYYGTSATLSEKYGVLNAAAKTGTSYRLVNGEIDWRSYTGWFLIIYPADDPKYSALKVIDASKSNLSVERGSKAFTEWYENH